MVSEWYHEQHEELVDQFMNIYNPTGAEPVPPSAIMYWQQNGQYGTPAADLAKGIDVGDQMSLPFEAGKTYRLRFINAGAFAMFQLQLEGHDWCASPSQSSDWSTRR
jgi:iron transport multicopper oxidase